MRPYATLLMYMLVVLLLGGCASRYVPQYTNTGIKLQWPPKDPKIIYQGSLTGFTEEGTSGISVVRTLAFGRESKGLFSNPVSFALGPNGEMAVADTGAKCVHLYLPKEMIYKRLTQAGHGQDFKSPVSVAFDKESMLYVSDSILRRIVIFDSKGELARVITKVNGEELKRPTGLAIDMARRTLYIIDTLQHKIFIVDRIGQKLSEFGQRGAKGSGFNFPTHIWFAPDRRIFITDAMNFRIQIFSAHGDFIGSFGHHGDGSGDFAMPKGVAVDKKGVIYVVDALFDNVQLFDEWGEFLLTVGGRGKGPGEFWLPSGIFIDNSHNKLYVCDTFNKRIQIFEIRD